MPAALRDHLPPARRQRGQGELVLALDPRLLGPRQPARRHLTAGHDRQRHGRERTGRLDLARGGVDPVHLRMQVGAEHALRHRQQPTQHLGEPAFVPLEPLAVARMGGLDQHRAGHLVREAAREQLRVQPAQRMAHQQVRRRQRQRGEQLAQAVHHHGAGLRQQGPAAAGHAEAVPGQHAAERLDRRVEPPPALQRHAGAVEQHQRGEALAREHVFQGAGGRRLPALARQRCPVHRRVRPRRCPR